MAINAQEVARELISYAVVTDKNGLVKLLERNGIQMPNNPSDNEVTIAVITASSESSTFKNELANYLSNLAPKAAKDYASFAGDISDFGFTGIDDFLFTGGEDFYNLTAEEREAKRKARITESNPKGKTKVGQALADFGGMLFSKENINKGIQLGLTVMNNKIQGKQNAKQQEALLIAEKEDELRKKLSESDKPLKSASKMKPITWVFIGVGVLALGGIIYYVAKKK